MKRHGRTLSCSSLNEEIQDSNKTCCTFPTVRVVFVWTIDIIAKEIINRWRTASPKWVVQLHQATCAWHHGLSSRERVFAETITPSVRPATILLRVGPSTPMGPLVSGELASVACHCVAVTRRISSVKDRAVCVCCEWSWLWWSFWWWFMLRRRWSFLSRRLMSPGKPVGVNQKRGSTVRDGFLM